MKTSIAEAVRVVLTLSAGALIAPVGAWAQQSSTPPQSTPEAGPTEEVVVIGRQRSAVTDVVQERIEQEVVVDLMGAEQISRVGDSNVSLALRRLPGVTLVSDQFIYIRGLGERYSSTTINGAYVPSPDLTRNVIPLDLFPAEIIDSLAIHKGFTADMPAAFGGGNVDIRTTGIPDEPVLDFTIGSGWNSNSSSRALSYRGGDDDRWGSDDGTRELPQEIKAAIDSYQGDISVTGILRGLNRDGQPHSIAQAQSVNRELATRLNRDLDFREGSSDPDFSAEAAAGNSWYFGSSEQWKVGALALVDYQNQWRQRDRITRSAGRPDTDFDNTQQTINNVALTGSLNLGLQYGEDHKLEATGIYLRNTDDETSLRTRNNLNFQRADGRQLRDYGIRYEERDLELAQFRGSHTLGDDTLELVGLADATWLNFAKGLNFSWYFSDATARTDIPNEVLVSAVDQIDPTTGEVLSTSLRPLQTSAEYRFTELEDQVESYGWSLSKPFEFGNTTLTLTGGQDLSEKGRSYLQTQLGIGTTSTAALPILAGTPGQVLSDDNLLDPANGFVFTMGGIGTESYLAAERIDAAFTKFDLDVNDRWRFSGGVRWENFRQIAVPINQYEYDINVSKIGVPLDQLDELITDEDDYYPSFALTYKQPDFWAEEFQVRLGWSETVARPDLREISPTIYIDPLNDARVQGNPNLVSASLSNYDLRAEWFFASGDNFTLSLFYKDIEDPIETVEGGGTDNDLALTFINADSAQLYGFEVEALKSLGFLANALGPWTDSFFLAGNVTVSDSEITIGNQAVSLTNNKRRMSQHSEYVANVQFGFDAPNREHSATLIYNFVGERIFYAGAGGAPDAIEQPFNSLDLVYTFFPTDLLSVKFRAQNLLDEKIEVERNNVVTLERDVGVTLKLDLALKF
jgi:TonB-dependent receptor